MFSIFGCQAGGVTPADCTLSAYILNEGKEQVAETGMFTTLNNKLLRASIRNAEVTDCTTLNLVWRPKQENIALKHPIAVLEQQMNLQSESSQQRIAPLQV
jgi:hypothetical protein